MDVGDDDELYTERVVHDWVVNLDEEVKNLCAEDFQHLDALVVEDEDCIAPVVLDQEILGGVIILVVLLVRVNPNCIETPEVIDEAERGELFVVFDVNSIVGGSISYVGNSVRMEGIIVSLDVVGHSIISNLET